MEPQNLQISLVGIRINGSGEESWRWWLTTVCNGFHLVQTARIIKGQETREKRGERGFLAFSITLQLSLSPVEAAGTGTVWIWYVLILVWLSRIQMGTKEDREDRYLFPSLWWSSVVSQSDGDRTTPHCSLLISGLWTVLERTGSNVKSTNGYYSQSL